MFKQLLLTIVGLLVCGLGFAQKKDTTAQKPPTKPVVLQKDNAAVQLRKPSQARMDEYLNDKDYQYQRDVVPPQNPIARFWYWLMSKLSEFFASKAYDSFWQYVFLAAIVALTAWLVYKSGMLGGMFAPTSRPLSDLDYELVNENIHEIEFEGMIDEAIAARNYRLAVRLYYLRSLKQLTDKGLIEWKPTKTNRTYVYELAKTPLIQDFEGITQQFEYVWYGDFAVSEDNFGTLKGNFQAFSDKVFQS